jgi:hypothetical protein
VSEAGIRKDLEQMRRIVLAVLAAFFAVLMGATAALAASPHFLYANSSVNNSGALSVSFKEAGLGNEFTSTQVTLTVDNASAVYQCWNKGGNHPQAGNKETVSTSLTNTATFPVRNGQTTGTLTVGPPNPGGFSCPNGQALYLMQVTYTGITVIGAAGDTAHATPDPVSTGPIMIRV